MVIVEGCLLIYYYDFSPPAFKNFLMNACRIYSNYMYMYIDKQVYVYIIIIVYIHIKVTQFHHSYVYNRNIQCLYVLAPSVLFDVGDAV